MIHGNRVLGIVLARAGSKGLPGKNFKCLDGKPLVQYAIEAGVNSKYLDNVVLSTDCNKCSDIAKKLGVASFTRPESLSGDSVGSTDVIIDLLNVITDSGDIYDAFVLLEPTSPLRVSADVDAALECLIKHGHRSLVSVCEAEDQHPSFMFTIKAKGRLETWSSEKFVALRRQDVGGAYYLDGSVYISFVDTFKRERSFCHSETGSLVVPKWKAAEIDDIWDFLYIEAVMNYRKSMGGE